MLLIKRLKTLILALTAAALFPAAASAQQLFISSVTVNYNFGGTDQNCTGPYTGVNFVNVSSYTGPSGTDSPLMWSSLIEFDRPKAGYPAGCLALCAQVTCVSTGIGTFGIDALTFEIFKFSPGANPYAPTTTPPLRTINLFNIGTCPNTSGAALVIGNYCASWDGSYNVEGEFGKTNGQFGFRAEVKTNQVSAQSGNITLSHTAAFPGQNQIPMQVDVANIHTVRSSPTVVGQSGVAAQPYNIMYKLSKDATTYINIWSSDGSNLTKVRTILNGVPRVGEGTPDGTLTNGDYWDGRGDNGQMMPSGVYLFDISAVSYDERQGVDIAWATTRQISIEPLQITDIKTKPLGPSATETANLSYLLTEAATVYVDIYPPGTPVGDVNTSPPTIPGYGNGDSIRVKRIKEQKDSRKAVFTFWDGRDAGGVPVPDGDYVYALYAELPSSLGGSPITIKTLRTYVGTLPVARGLVGISQVQTASTVIGGTPTVAGLNPFYFKYTVSRDAAVNVRLYDSTGQNLVKTLVRNEIRVANFVNNEVWDGVGDNGNYVSTGTYLAELTAIDPFQPSKVSTITALFPVGLFRVVDVKAESLLGGASDMATISYQLSQTMDTNLSIYPPGTIIANPMTVWPPVISTPPVFTFQGVRPGRYTITERWDGKDQYGLFVPDGQYVYVLVARSTGTAGVIYPTDRNYGYISVARGHIAFNKFEIIPTVPILYNSSATVKLPPFDIAYSLTRQSSVTVQVLSTDLPVRAVATLLSGDVRDANVDFHDFWDGRDDSKNFVPGGAYTIRATAQDITGQITSLTTVQQTIDVFPLRIYDVAVTPLRLDQPTAVVSYQVSEPMKVVTKIYRPGTSFDPSGNPKTPESSSLVKRMVGIRPARTLISEMWDGTDMKLSLVNDGNYMFRIYASSDSTSIDSITGNVLSGVPLADDLIISEVPVTREGTADVCGEFESETYFYPNPLRAAQGTFRVWFPIQAKTGMKIHNLAGDLVFERDFGEQPRGELKYTWARKNSSNKPVAHGIYFAVFRLEASAGTRDICQTVKKILIP